MREKQMIQCVPNFYQTTIYIIFSDRLERKCTDILIFEKMDVMIYVGDCSLHF
jgi:hypothetical protein